MLSSFSFVSFVSFSCLAAFAFKTFCNLMACPLKALDQFVTEFMYDWTCLLLFTSPWKVGTFPHLSNSSIKERKQEGKKERIDQSSVQNPYKRRVKHTWHTHIGARERLSD
ncbi:hypothetical protein AA313_de0203574 [Arthrobotrys entomopaga]|nr:hypothetical protein AA313_de0203574 [Arthrobotrys entomopaga]